MGRPPIGKQAMSGAERTRRYRAKLRHSAPVTKPAGGNARAFEARITALKRRIAELERRGAKTQRMTAAQKFFPGIYAVQTRVCAIGGACNTRAEPAFVAAARWNHNVPTDGYVLKRGPKDYVVLSVSRERYRTLEDAMVQVPARVEP